MSSSPSPVPDPVSCMVALCPASKPTPAELLERLHKYIGKIAANQAGRLGLDGDDLFQEMALAVLQRAGGYDPGRGRPETWANVAVARRAVRSLMRRRGREEAAGGLLDAPDRERAGEDADAPLELEIVRAAVDRLPEREAHVIRRRFGLDGQAGALLAAIGAELGMTEEGARQVEKRALVRLRRLVGVGPPVATPTPAGCQAAAGPG